MDFEALQRRLLARVRTRVRNGELTERGLARMIGISQPHMHHILKGVRALSLENADRILKRLNLTVLDLLEGGGTPHRIPSALPPIAGTDSDGEGESIDLVVENWRGSSEYARTDAQPREVL